MRLPSPVDPHEALAWVHAPSRREPWRTDLSELRRAMTAEELEEWQRLTAGPSVLREIGGEA